MSINGNDEIIKENNEKETDNFSNIRLLEKMEYKSLSDEEKQEYVRYSPSLQSEAYAAWLNAQNGMIKTYNQMVPLFDKLQPFTKGGKTLSPIPLDSVIKSIESVTKTAESMGSVVNTIASTAIVNIVAEPLRNLFGLVGALGGLVYALYMNPYQFIEPYVSAIKSIDLDGLIDYFNSETTPNIALTTPQVEALPIPDVEIAAEVKAGLEQVKNLQPSAQQMLQVAQSLKAASEALKGIPKGLKAVSTMGVSWAFDAGLNEFDINFEQAQSLSTDPNGQAKQWADNVNGLINKLPEKYIKVSDLQKLKELEKSKEDA